MKRCLLLPHQVSEFQLIVIFEFLLFDKNSYQSRDAPLFVLSVCTLGMVISKEREVVVSLPVYNKAGKRIKEYSASEIYYTAGIGFPLALLYTEKICVHGIATEWRLNLL